MVEKKSTKTTPMAQNSTVDASAEDSKLKVQHAVDGLQTESKKQRKARGEKPVEDLNAKSKATLFLRNIPFDASKDELESFFSAVGPIKNCFIVTKENNESKGIGFVQFSVASDALKAMDDLKSKKFKGNRIIKMELANKKAQVGKESIEDENQPLKLVTETKPINLVQKPARIKGKKPRMIVRNLPFRCTVDDLKAVFSPFGKLVDCKLPLKENGKACGFGFVEYESVKIAENAMSKINGTEIAGRIVAVDWSIPKDMFDESQGIEPITSKKKTESVQDENIKKPVSEKVVFEENAITVQNVEKDEQSSKEKVISAVGKTSTDVVSDSEADDFEMIDVEVGSSDEELDGDEEMLDAEDVQSTPEKTENPMAIAVEEQTTLFIRNLSFESTEEDLYEKFSFFGPLRYARITMDHVAGHSKGTGFVAFVSKADTEKCLLEYKKAYKISSETEIAGDESSKKQKRFGNAKSVLIAEPSLNSSTTPFVLHGRFLNVSIAVSKSEAGRLMESNRVEKQHTDKRNLYLMKEGVIFPDSEAAKDISPTEISKRQASYSERKRLLASNPNLFVSKTRLSVRNLGTKVSEVDLNKAAFQAVIDFWKDVEKGERKMLDDYIMEDEKVAGKSKPGPKRKIVIRQVKIIRDKERIDAGSNKPRSKGYGFIEFASHADAIACLRVLNNNPLAFAAVNGGPSKLRPIVEFSVENSLVLKQRDENRKKHLEKKKFDEKNAAIIKKNRDREAEEATRKPNTPRERVIQADYFVKKPAPKRTHEPEVRSVAAKKHRKEVSGKARNQDSFTKTNNTPTKDQSLSSKIEVSKTKPLKPLSRNQKRELQKEDKFDSLVQKYKQDIFGGRNEDKSLQTEAQRWFAGVQ